MRKECIVRETWAHPFNKLGNEMVTSSCTFCLCSRPVGILMPRSDSFSVIKGTLSPCSLTVKSYVGFHIFKFRVVSKSSKADLIT